MVGMLDAVWQVWLQLSPWLLLGAAAAGLLHVLLPRDFARRQFRGLGGVGKAVALGVPLPLCSCGVIPAGLGLKKDGAAAVYHRLPVAAGRHRIVARLRDRPGEGFDYTGETMLELAPGASLLSDFSKAQGGFVFRS